MAVSDKRAKADGGFSLFDMSILVVAAWCIFTIYYYDTMPEITDYFIKCLLGISAFSHCYSVLLLWATRGSQR